MAHQTCWVSCVVESFCFFLDWWEGFGISKDFLSSRKKNGYRLLSPGDLDCLEKVWQCEKISKMGHKKKNLKIFFLVFEANLFVMPSQKHLWIFVQKNVNMVLLLHTYFFLLLLLYLVCQSCMRTIKSWHAWSLIKSNLANFSWPLDCLCEENHRSTELLWNASVI